MLCGCEAGCASVSAAWITRPSNWLCKALHCYIALVCRAHPDVGFKDWARCGSFYQALTWYGLLPTLGDPGFASAWTVGCDLCGVLSCTGAALYGRQAGV